jgi:hypothetical protein
MTATTMLILINSLKTIQNFAKLLWHRRRAQRGIVLLPWMGRASRCRTRSVMLVVSPLHTLSTNVQHWLGCTMRTSTSRVGLSFWRKSFADTTSFYVVHVSTKHNHHVNQRCLSPKQEVDGVLQEGMCTAIDLTCANARVQLAASHVNLDVY